MCKQGPLLVRLPSKSENRKAYASIKVLQSTVANASCGTKKRFKAQNRIKRSARNRTRCGGGRSQGIVWSCSGLKTFIRRQHLPSGQRLPHLKSATVFACVSLTQARLAREPMLCLHPTIAASALDIIKRLRPEQHSPCTGT